MTSTASEKLAQEIKQEARRIGFEACGISRAEVLDEEARRLEQWLNEGRNGSMEWMERNFDKRIDPRKLVDGARSVISVLHNYYQPTAHSEDPETGKISRYAWGDDYHLVMKEMLFELFNWLGGRVGDINGRAFVDSAPVMDKVWARKSGLGWIGKHSNLLNRSMGSFFFTGELIVDVSLPPDSPVPDFCGSCTRCIDACPTDAIYHPYVVDSNKCISYLTIENRAEIPASLGKDMGNWIFGCDICQEVCPWNKFSKPTHEEKYLPREGIRDTPLKEWMEIDLDEFRRRFRKSAVKRAKPDGFRRNVKVALNNIGD